MKTKLLTKDLVLPATTGQNTIAQAKDIFTGWIDSDFKHWGLDAPQESTAETKIAVLEMTQDATFRELFLSPETQTLTQSQIIEFVQKHREHLRQNGYATFFLFKKGDEFFVADVCLSAARPLVDVYRFDDDFVWVGDRRPRVVVPQLTLDPSDQTLSPLETLTPRPLISALSELTTQVQRIADALETYKKPKKLVSLAKKVNKKKK